MLYYSRCVIITSFEKIVWQNHKQTKTIMNWLLTKHLQKNSVAIRILLSILDYSQFLTVTRKKLGLNSISDIWQFAVYVYKSWY